MWCTFQSFSFKYASSSPSISACQPSSSSSSSWKNTPQLSLCSLQQSAAAPERASRHICRSRRRRRRRFGLRWTLHPRRKSIAEVSRALVSACFLSTCLDGSLIGASDLLPGRCCSSAAGRGAAASGRVAEQVKRSTLIFFPSKV